MIRFHSALLGFACLFTPISAHEVLPVTDEQAEEYKLDRDFFKKGTMVEDILIATSDKVSDYAHLEAAYQFGKMMTKLKPEISKRIREGGVLCILVGHDELTSDIPQFRNDKTGEELAFYNWRSRGFLTRVEGRPVVLFSEEDVLEFEGGMRDESILIHEFGHVIHRPGFYEGLDEELKKTWEDALAKGLWNDGRAAQRFRRVRGDEPVLLLDALVKAFPDRKPELLKLCLDGGDILVNGEPTDSKVEITGKDDVRIVFGGPKDCYASKNRAEYFAEIVQAWFDTNRVMDHDHNHIDTREELKSYDPGGYAFLEKIFNEDDWRFVSPRERAGKDHLKGYDPENAPVVIQPDFIKDAANDYYDEYWSKYWERLEKKYADRLGTADDA
ncbi:hypothetical protein HAHE_06960 [Haloferula helveola]|uniref:Uncharacterized protein n=1 Tax=Haloferula helveola TaxID=490095 RepID=A0ABN6GZY4_9BACT|nr:hypothetical protein HAHE_06960 [Haloferula helveola]